MNLTVGLLSTLNNVSKLLKNRDVAFLNGVIIGLDNADVYITKVRLPTMEWFDYDKYMNDLDNEDKYAELCNNYNINFLYKQRDLSAFIKNITNESIFNIDAGISKSTIYTKINNLPLDIITSRQAILYAYDRLEETHKIDKAMFGSPYLNVDITKDLEKLFEMKKTDGMYHYIFDGKYYITVFSGLLPLNKKDKLYLSILDDPKDTYFIAKFRISKSDAEVYVYIKYLKIPSRVLV